MEFHNNWNYDEKLKCTVKYGLEEREMIIKFMFFVMLVLSDC